MSGVTGRPRMAALEEILENARDFEFGEVNVERARMRYRDEGYEVTSWLEEFIENYSELTVEWQVDPWPTTALTTNVESALEEFPGNIRYYARRIGKLVLPVGAAFETDERILLAQDGEMLLAGDAGIQRVGFGFETFLRALLTGDWDKTFH
ncbi:SUKH-3 domain-containing protein [Amycolatopsis sp. NPDC001319]|uniref:SUKH-3 domain-containing protein n=1 Tax=unclassified Amycolatopsis TaxID=2618356 RepID=UPI0036BFB894